MTEPAQSVPAAPVYLTANIRGVVIPTWVALALGVAAFLSAMSLCLSLFLVRDASLAAAAANRELAKEMRILQVHAQDIENVLIRQGLARRSDFAPWPEGREGTIDMKPHKGN